MSHLNFAPLARNPRRFLPLLAVAIGALALSSVRAQAAMLTPIKVTAYLVSARAPDSREPAEAAPLEPITISAPAARAERTVGHDGATGAPIQEITSTARVKFNPVILRTHSGVALLRDDVAEAARKACDLIDPLGRGEVCVGHAIRSAQPQVTAAITRARSIEPG